MLILERAELLAERKWGVQKLTVRSNMRCLLLTRGHKHSKRYVRPVSQNGTEDRGLVVCDKVC